MEFLSATIAPIVNLAVLGFEITFKRDTFHINLFGTFQEMTFKGLEIRVLALCVNYSYRSMT